MAAPTFTALPTAPSRQDSPETFNTEADAFVAALSTFQTEGNTLGTFCETQANTAETHKNSAATSASLISSTITTHTNLTDYNNDTPADGELVVLLIS